MVSDKRSLSDTWETIIINCVGLCRVFYNCELQTNDREGEIRGITFLESLTGTVDDTRLNIEKF